MSPVFSHYCIYSNCHREEAKYDDDAENIKGDDTYGDNDAFGISCIRPGKPRPLPSSAYQNVIINDEDKLNENHKDGDQEKDDYEDDNDNIDDVVDDEDADDGDEDGPHPLGQPGRRGLLRCENEDEDVNDDDQDKDDNEEEDGDEDGDDDGLPPCTAWSAREERRSK